jgi:two-component system chemotaxis response regulator CheB
MSDREQVRLAKSRRGVPEGVEPPAVVAIASSAGGLAALTRVLGGFDAGFPGAILVVQHLDRHHRSLIADILNRRTNLPVKQAEDGDTIVGGRALVAPPDNHLLANLDSTVSLTRSELVHFVRPSADLLFESVAAAYRERAVAVVLTGSGIDGAMGVQAIKKMGGTVIVQDEDTAEFFSMPAAAIATGDVDEVLPLDEISRAIAHATQRASG